MSFSERSCIIYLLTYCYLTPLGWNFYEDRYVFYLFTFLSPATKRVLGIQKISATHSELTEWMNEWMNGFNCYCSKLHGYFGGNSSVNSWWGILLNSLPSYFLIYSKPFLIPSNWISAFLLFDSYYPKQNWKMLHFQFAYWNSKI